MRQTSYATCSLCEACCGLVVEHEDNRVLSIRGDKEDPLSRGYICPKGAALGDLHDDPDRLRTPMRRVGDRWEEISWDEAIAETADRIVDIQRRHGRNAVAVYTGNPAIHSYSAVLFGMDLVRAIGTRNAFSATSVDALPRMLTSLLMYGSQAILPIPDIDRTDFMLILGANPAVSNGSVMTAPGCGKRLKEIRKRGGRVVVVDPRRTETADIASEHLFIRPGGDAFLLLAMIHTIFAEDLADAGAITGLIDGWDTVRTLVEPFAPARVADTVGIDAETIAQLARDFAGAPSAVCYGRMGTCTQEYGTVASWLVDVLNICTGNFDRPGGAMFPAGAVDLPALAAKLGQTGSFDRWRSRVSNLPEFNGEFPVSGFAEEIEQGGEGQIRALITNAGNPVLSLPNGRRLDRAFASLDFMVSIDIYRNETTRHADIILPTTFGLEHDHYPLVFGTLSVRNAARYSAPVLDAHPDAREDWEIYLDLAAAVIRRRDGLAARLKSRLLGGTIRRLGPRRVLGLALRMGPYRGVNLRRLMREPHGIDLGPLKPRVADILRTPGKRIQLAPERIVADIARVEAALAGSATGGTVVDIAPAVGAKAGGPLQLIGRRTLRSNNSWMHNTPRLLKGKHRCTLRMHPDDAEARDLDSGDQVTISTRIGSVTAPVEISDEMMPGVVSLPHGWGHDRDGARLQVAADKPGVSANDITDDRAYDSLSGVTNFSGIPVTVSRVEAAQSKSRSAG